MSRYDIDTLIERCRKMNLTELTEYLRSESEAMRKVRTTSDDAHRYKELLCELVNFVTGEPRLVSSYNKAYIKEAVAHLVLANELSQDILQYLE